MEFSDSDRLEIREWIDSCFNIKSMGAPSSTNMTTCSPRDMLYIILYIWSAFPRNNFECVLLFKIIKEAANSLS